MFDSFLILFLRFIFDNHFLYIQFHILKLVALSKTLEQIPSIILDPFQVWLF